MSASHKILVNNKLLLLFNKKWYYTDLPFINIADIISEYGIPTVLLSETREAKTVFQIYLNYRSKDSYPSMHDVFLFNNIK